MQIVIDIQDDVYKGSLVYKDVQLEGTIANDLSELTTAVANGIPLPKGHGDLVELGKVVDMVTEYVPDDDGLVGNTNLKDLLYEVENIEPVIEADRGDKNE